MSGKNTSELAQQLIYFLKEKNFAVFSAEESDEELLFVAPISGKSDLTTLPHDELGLLEANVLLGLLDQIQS